jgi:hypothetical protein
MKDTGKGDKLYIDNTHITGEAFETAVGSNIYALEGGHYHHRSRQWHKAYCGSRNDHPDKLE